MLLRLIEVEEGNRLRRVGNVTSDMRLIAHELEASSFLCWLCKPKLIFMYAS